MWEGEEDVEELAIGTSRVEVKNLIKEHAREIWAKEWNTDTTCRQTKLFLNEPDARVSKKIMRYGRSRIKLIIEAITGQNELSYLQNIIDSEVAPVCRLCLESDEHFSHLMWECPALEAERLRIGMTVGGREWEVQQLVDLLDLKSVSDLMEGYMDYQVH